VAVRGRCNIRRSATTCDSFVLVVGHRTGWRDYRHDASARTGCKWRLVAAAGAASASAHSQSPQLLIFASFTGARVTRVTQPAPAPFRSLPSLRPRNISQHRSVQIHLPHHDTDGVISDIQSTSVIGTVVFIVCW